MFDRVDILELGESRLDERFEGFASRVGYEVEMNGLHVAVDNLLDKSGQRHWRNRVKFPGPHFSRHAAQRQAVIVPWGQQFRPIAALWEKRKFLDDSSVLS